MKIERKLWDIVEKYYIIIFIVVISMIGIWIRFSGKDFISRDMTHYLIPWYDEFKKTGLKGLSSQVGDYNLLYQTMIALFTYINIKNVYMYKILSCIFDFLLAFTCGYTLCGLKGKNCKNDITTFSITYTVVLFIPTVILNSSVWGQCDSIYVTFVIWTIYFLYKEKYRKAFIFLGIAFAFKLQSIFIIPIVLYMYFTKKKFSILNLGYTVLSLWLSGIGGYINGRSIWAVFDIYMNQAKEHQKMYIGYPSFWLIVGSDYALLKQIAILLTVVILGVGLYLVLSEKKKIDTLESYLNTVCWSVWSMILFLPAMHERYSYMLDIMLVMLCIYKGRKYLCYAIVELLLSLITYGHYLFYNGQLCMEMGIINLILWCIFTCVVFNVDLKEK